MEINNKYWIWLSRIKDITAIKKNMLLNKYKKPETIWNLNKTELESCKYLTEKNISDILNIKYRENLQKYEKYLIENNIKIININDEIYPSKLNNIYDKPVVLYAKGNLKLLNSSSIAMVGCRECSIYGKSVAKELAYKLAKNRKCIISGLAKGIDANAHIGALAVNGRTIAVLGSGLNNIYPTENKPLANEILKRNGLLISEYIIDATAEKKNFPERNRIISGLSDGIVVIEAKEKSGALITVDFGLEQGKDIFAVPGNINSKNSAGTNELLKQGANLVTDYRDIIDICYNY